MLKYFLLGSLAFIISGCMTVSPTVSEYKIQPHIKAPSLAAKGCQKYSLKVAQAFSTTTLMRSDMHYGVGKFQEFTFSQSKWSVSPNQIVTYALRDAIEKTAIFKNVQIAQSRSRNDFLLEVTLNDFMQYFSKDEQTSFVNVALTLTLIDTKTSRVIATRSFHSKQDVATLSAQGGVEALSKALNKVLQTNVVWLSGVCK